MALVLGTNCGFVTSRPFSDPVADETTVDGRAQTIKDTSTSSSIRITEIGWWCDTATGHANYEVGIYSDDATGEPNLILFSDTTNAKGLTAGWKRAMGLDWVLNANTIYWIAIQLDETMPLTKSNRRTTGGPGYAYKSGRSTLPSPDWLSNTGAQPTGMYGIYALYELVPEGKGTLTNITVENITQNITYTWSAGVWDVLPEAVEGDSLSVTTTITNDGGATDTLYGQFDSIDVTPSESLIQEEMVNVGFTLLPSWSFTMPTKDVYITLNSGHLE